MNKFLNIAAKAGSTHLYLRREKVESLNAGRSKQIAEKEREEFRNNAL
jgi:hypothetical protein